MLSLNQIQQAVKPIKFYRVYHTNNLTIDKILSPIQELEEIATEQLKPVAHIFKGSNTAHIL